MGLFRRGRRDDAYDDLDTPEREADPDDRDFDGRFADDYEDEEPGGSVAATLSKIMAVLVVGGLFVAVVLYAYSWSVGQRSEGGRQIPVVEAQPGPEKVKPEDPGGMDVPYQDQLVLNQGDGDSDREAERLLPPPESPSPLPEPTEKSDTGKTGSASSEGDAATSEATTQRDAVGESPEERQIARDDSGRDEPDRSGDGDTAAPADRNGATPEDRRALPAPPKPKPEPPAGVDTAARDASGRSGRETDAAASARSGNGDSGNGNASTATGGDSGILIQLAAFQNRDNARAAWRRMQDSHSPLLGRMSLQLQRVRIEDRGIFWRVRTGPFPNRATAADMCTQLKDRGQACLVVRK